MVPQESLREHFGFETFRPGQEEVIDHLLAGRSAAAVFPTGAGKSLCYQLPALHLQGLTLVVSPLIALMKDQIDQLTARGISAARLDSSLSGTEFRQVTSGIRSGDIKILYVAPERFNNERFRESLGQQKISLMAVDEAHCISEWGHNFRPDYLKLAGYARMMRAERILALTATAPPKVLDDICQGFNIPPEQAVRTGFFRPNLTLLATPVDPAERDAALVERLQEREPGPAIIYVTLQRTAEDLAERLNQAGLTALAYHAGMKPEERNHIQETFLASDRAIVVATIAFGMGIDKADVRYVYHYNLPKSLEGLAQEIGRAGRDGKPSICEMFVCEDDLNVLRNFALGDTPSKASIRSLVGELFSGDQELALDFYKLSVEHDIRQLVLRTLLTQLELDQLLKAGTPFYSTYRFKPLVNSQEMLSRFSGERREFLRSVLRQAQKARTWFDIDLDTTAQNLNQPRNRLIRALDYLAEQNLMELRLTGVRHSYAVQQRPEDLDQLADTLHQRALDLEAREMKRLDQVLDLAALEDCRWTALCQYFGETREQPCENCTWCFEGEAPSRVEPPDTDIDVELWSKATALRQEKPEALADNRAFARFLTGLTSPKLGRQRLSSHALFGSLAQVPFALVLERAASRGTEVPRSDMTS